MKTRVCVETIMEDENKKGDKPAVAMYGREVDGRHDLDRRRGIEPTARETTGKVTGGGWTETASAAWERGRIERGHDEAVKKPEKRAGPVNSARDELCRRFGAIHYNGRRIGIAKQTDRKSVV